MPDSISSPFSILEIRLPQNNEYTLESMSSLFSNFTQFSNLGFFEKLTGKKKTIASLEITLLNGQIRFFVVTKTEDAVIAASKLSYPVIIRAAYTLGGQGSGF